MNGGDETCQESNSTLASNAAPTSNPTALPFPTIITTRRVVPNQFPIRDTPYRIALVGESPGETEENYGIPFCGPSGNFLNGILKDVGIDRHACFAGNICQVRPPGNRIDAFDWNGKEIQDGLKQLNEDLNTFSPNICVLLGGTPLRAARGIESPITSWRGSLFSGAAGPFLGRKCVASLHPAFVLREFSGYPLLQFDLKRAAEESPDPTLTLPVRELLTSLDASILTYIMDTWPSGQRCSLDIEGGLDGWPCVSLCARPTKSITIAWGRLSELEHLHVLRSFARLMSRIDVPKVLQNSLYDNFVLSYGFGIPIRNVAEDTMLKGWEVYCELPKGLGTQTSIYTREPYYKAERKSEDSEVFFQYCAKDSAVTLEIAQVQDSMLEDGARAHYRFNLSMLNPLLFMECRGIQYDKENAAKKKAEVAAEISLVATALNDTAGGDLRGKKGSLSSTKLAACLYQLTESFTGTGKKRTKDNWTISKYPPQFKKEAGRKTEKLTTDVEALLILSRKLEGDKFIENILQHRHLEGLLETLSISTDSDGRVRCGYNVVGTETGRLTCYGSPTGSGANLTTITKSLRINYVADPDHDFFQADLEGADAWTVAAHCFRLGDPTMWNDLRAGFKPAKILVLLYVFGDVINKLSRDDLAFWHDKEKGWKAIEAVVGKGFYDCAKATAHGSNYLMGIPTLIKNVLLKSYKYIGTPIYLEHAVATFLQKLYFLRYPGVRTWHQWAESTLVAKGELSSASGQTRVFFGRRFGKDIHDTVKEFLAHEPQSNTTYATNLAMLRLWNDPANRITRREGRLLNTASGETHYLPQSENAWSRFRPGGLLIEPLHQVHDALCGQWPSFLREWGREKVREWFNNELEIAGTKLVIPFDGTWGPSWGNMPNKL